MPWELEKKLSIFCVKIFANILELNKVFTYSMSGLQSFTHYPTVVSNATEDYSIDHGLESLDASL